MRKLIGLGATFLLATAALSVVVAVGVVVSPHASAQGVVLDADSDGLIEIQNLAQLNAMRWDPDGDGKVGTNNRASYHRAFPDAELGIGCPDSGCNGYELVADLDFDTNNNGRADAGDTYWNGGAGWEPIDLRGSTFDGGGYTF